MPKIHLEWSTTRSELRQAHELIAELDGSPVALALGQSLRPNTPGQYGAWIQLVLMWGQDTTQRVLLLETDTIARISRGQPLSDVEIVAVLLAEEVWNGDVNVTEQVQPPARTEFVKRNVLTAHTGDGDELTSSLLLASHIFSNLTSPELHAAWEGELAVEETARTLYHDIWPMDTAPQVLRQPLPEFGEVAVPGNTPTHITRTELIPGDSNGAATHFSSLGARAPRQRGVALELASQHRSREKPVYDEVGEMLFELVQNTEWHASKWPGGRTGANCRVVSFREYSFDPGQLNAAEIFDPNFVKYVRAAAQSAQRRLKRKVTRVTLGSATVIDSGVGLARSVAMSLDEEHLLTPQTEVSYLIKALSKNLKRRRVDLGNIGLARVQQSLTNLSGFMSIRTGTVEILRDFVTTPFEPLSGQPRKAPPSLILDWIPPREEDFIVGPRLGTDVTIVYPVAFEAVE